MEYRCSVCELSVEGGLVALKDHTDKHVIDLIKFDHPEWITDNGVCEKCHQYYKAEIDGSIFKDAPCVKRIRLIKKIFRPIKKFFLQRNVKQT